MGEHIRRPQRETVTTNETEVRAAKATLVVGFVAFIIATAAARATPANGYELSIYWATPDTFWAGVSVAILASLVVSLSPVAGRVRQAALVLGGACIVALAGLPVLRGYYYYGTGDALSHLGFTRLFASGAMSPTEFLHPGVHIISILVDGASATGLRRALMLTVVTFVLVFVVFVPLCAVAITGRKAALGVGLFSAALLLPINNVSVHPLVHPISQAILFLPAQLFLLSSYLTQSAEGDGLTEVTPVGILLAVTSAAIVILHPQQALNVVFLFGVIALLQFLSRRYRPHNIVARHRTLYAQTAFVSLVFGIWAPRSPRFQNTATALVNGLFGGAPPADEITQRGVSLGILGGSLEELFLKLFLASLVFSVIAGVFVVASMTGRFDGSLPERNSLVKYIALGFVPGFGLFAAFFMASYTTQPFRYLGFLMVAVTVIGAAALAHIDGWFERRGSRRLVRTALVVGFAALLLLSATALHSSPYIYQSNSQVTESRMGGYETAFGIRDPDIAFAGVSGGPKRYVDAIYGPGTPQRTGFLGDDASVPGRVFDDASYVEYYETDRYLVVTESDVQREVVLYDGFRYSEAGFDSVATTPGINRVQASGGLDVYLIRGETEQA
jgi:hypothetical protein